MSLSAILIPAIIALVALLVVIGLWKACYKIAPTDRILVITGLGKRRFVTGGAAFVIPGLYRTDYISLGVVQCDLKSEKPIPTKDQLLIDVSAVANFQIGQTKWTETVTDPDGTERTIEHDPVDMAARNYLNQKKGVMEADVTQVLLGKMREAIGQTALEDLMSKRDVFNSTVMSAAAEDMRNLGLELTTFNVKDFTDRPGVDANGRPLPSVIVALGAERANEITQAAQESNIRTQTQIAIKQNELDLKRASLKASADKAKAEADLVYETTKAGKTKELNIAEVDAKIAAEERNIELADKQAAVKEKQLNATVRKQAEADRYAAEQAADAQAYTAAKQSEADKTVAQNNADAQAYLDTKNAEAQLTVATRNAEAVKAKADADAHATTVAGDAEASAITARGKAEGDAIEAQGQAYEKNGRLILVQQYINALPQLVAAAAAPLNNVDRITMYGEGNQTKLVGDTTNTLDQIQNALGESLGLDLKSMLNAAVAGGAAGHALAKSGEVADIPPKPAEWFSSH